MISKLAIVFLLLVLLPEMAGFEVDSSEIGDDKRAKQYRALIISGVGGDLKQSEKFQRLANELYELLRNDFGYSGENIVYLAGDAGKTDTHVSGQSTKKNITSAITELKKRAAPEDQTLVFVIGHADFRNDAARIHLPREDITPEEFGELFEDFPGILVSVITTPVSGFFLRPLSGDGRVVITATKAGIETDETFFPAAFIEAVKEIGDSEDPAVSIAKVFSLARRKTEEHYREQQANLREHPMLDDNGDGEGTSELGEGGDEGDFASTLFIGPREVSSEMVVADTGLLESGKKWEKLRPPAVVLLRDIEYTVHSDLTYRTKERKQIKILNKGGHRYSEVMISYNIAYETLSIESAKTIKPDGEIDELNPNEILDVKATRSLMYTESRYKRFSMPSIEDGCVIDYTFVKTGKNLHLSRDFWRTFVIEQDIPQDEFRITFNIPKTERITHKFTKEDFQFDLEKEEDEGEFSRTFRFVMKDIPPLVPEANSPPVQELSTRLIVTSISSWDDIWRWYKELSDGARDSDEEIESLVGQITKGKTTDLAKAREIYDWVSENVRYVGLELGKHGYQPHKATSILSNKFGDCKDKTTLLLSMLDVAGVKGGDMVLIPTNAMAQVDTSMPTLDQFNHAIATIVIDGKRYWLDTSVGETAFGDIPVSDQDRMVFVVGDDEGEFMVVPADPPEENLLDNRSDLALSEEGTISGRDVITYTGAFSTAFRRKYKYAGTAEQKQALENVLSKFIPAAKLDKYTIEGIDTLAERIVYTREYKANEYAPKADDLLILNVPLQNIGMTEIVSTATRAYPLVIGQMMTRKGEVKLRLPEGYRVRNKPRPVDMRNDFGSYMEKYEFDEKKGVLRSENSFELRRVRVEPEEYTEFKKFIDEIARTQRRLVILIRE